MGIGGFVEMDEMAVNNKLTALGQKVNSREKELFLSESNDLYADEGDGFQLPKNVKKEKFC